jgi:hypothetical protein
MTLTEKPTRQVRRALASQSQTVPTQRLTEEIMAQGAARAAAATAAAARAGCLPIPPQPHRDLKGTSP